MYYYFIDFTYAVIIVNMILIFFFFFSSVIHQYVLKYYQRNYHGTNYIIMKIRFVLFLVFRQFRTLDVRHIILRPLYFFFSFQPNCNVDINRISDTRARVGCRKVITIGFFAVLARRVSCSANNIV